MLKAQKNKILNDGKEVRLHGVNVGGWLMPEGYIVHAPNRGYRFFKENFINRFGERQFAFLETAFRDNFITENDFAKIRGLGLNYVRVPFHYALIEQAPYQYSQTGLAYLDRAVEWAKKNGLWVILDMHAAPGAQNHDWHSDSDGLARFWNDADNQKRAAALWAFLADHFKNEEAIAGYDLLNETVIDDPKPMNAYYQAAIKAIRAVDKKHIIFVEGNRWAQDIACLDDFEDDNIVLSIHFYEPLEFTFNFVPFLKYPLRGWDADFMRKRIESMKAVADQKGRALWCGEFGVNSRQGLYGEDKWLEDLLKVFNDMDIHWTYWTWKAVKHSIFPDGINCYIPNDPWVNRAGPDFGWDSWHRNWQDKKGDMIMSWSTKVFTEQTAISKVLKNAA